MARGTPTVNSGSLGAVGSGQVENVHSTLRTELKAYQSNSTDAWAEVDVVDSTPATYNSVFHSIGDRTLGSGSNAGDTDLFCRIYKSSTTIYFVPYQDWTTDSGGSGQRPANSTTYNKISMNDTSAVDWWRVSNEYEFSFLVRQDGVFNWAWMGHPIRPYAPGLTGRARVSVATSTTGSVTISLDRDIRSGGEGGAGDDIQVGQNVWLLNQTPDAAALKSAYTEIVEVTAVTSNSITVSGVANQPYEIGSLVGLDPAPMGCFVEADGDTTVTWVQDRNTDYTINGKRGPVEHEGQILSEAAHDPGADGLFPIFDAIMRVNTGTNGQGLRGYSDIVGFTPVGTQTDNDRMLDEIKTAKGWKVFPSLLNSSHAACIGYGSW